MPHQCYWKPYQRRSKDIHLYIRIPSLTQGSRCHLAAVLRFSVQTEEETHFSAQIGSPAKWSNNQRRKTISSLPNRRRSRNHLKSRTTRLSMKSNLHSISSIFQEIYSCHWEWFAERHTRVAAAQIVSFLF